MAAEKRMTGRKKKIMCIGDSLTFGSVGYSYLTFLDPQLKAINRGVNGDTTRCAYRRLEACLNSPRHQDVDTYVIGIGTNDIFLPYLSGVSLLWKMQMRQRCRIKKCILDDRTFRKEYERYLKLLAAHKKKIVLIGIPFFELKNAPLDKIKRRNATIKDLARRYQGGFVDIYGLQASARKQPGLAYSWKHRNAARLVDAFIMLMLPFTKDVFARLRHLELTVDGLHYNSTSACLLGEAVSRVVQEPASHPQETVR